MQRDNYTCQYCHVREPGLTIDHIKPRSKGGSDSWNNVVACCKKCNVKKGSLSLKDASMKLKKRPEPPHGHLHFELSSLAKHSFPDWQKYIIGLTA